MHKTRKIIVTLLTSLFLLPIILQTTAIVESNNKHLFLVINNSFTLKDNLSDKEINFLMRLGHIPSLSACIIKNNSVVWYRGYGHSKLLIRQKPTIDTIYPIACITKTVTATALMTLYDKGLFGLDDDVNDYLDFKVRNPNYPDTPITFRMLLAHQSSLGGLDLPKHYLINCYKKNKNDYPYPMIKELITPNGSLYIPKVWLNIPPGSDCEYTSIDIILLEHLIEVLSKQKFIDYCKKNIFNPLNMSNTGFHVKDFKRSLLAISYLSVCGLYFRLPFTEGVYGWAGLRTSIEDLSHFIIAHMNKGVWNGVRILNESTVEMMHTPQYPNSTCFDNNPERYGLGWIIWMNDSSGIIFYGHAGLGIGMTTGLFINNSNDWALLFFINKYVDMTKKIEREVYVKIINDLLFKARDF